MAAHDQEPSPTNERLVGVERRIVSVLFADVVGFTSLSEQLDPEDVATIQDRYYAQARAVVERYGGSLEKFIGDAVVAAFGVPRARDDDAERAVHAGLALIAAVERVGAELGFEPGWLQLRIGVNTGEVAYASSGPDAGRITGDIVNVAARLQAAAPPGRVLVGQQTALAISPIAILEEEQQLPLKGKAAEVPACLVTGLRSTPSRDAALGALRAPLIGRQAELTKLHAAVTSAPGHADRWLIVAPPGVGKSRLVNELAATATDRVRVVAARSRPDVVNPYQVVGDLLLLTCERWMTQDVITALEAALPLSGLPPGRCKVIAEEVACLLDPASAVNGLTGSGTDRDARFAAWLDAFDALSAAQSGAGKMTAVRRPSLWLVEDVHWAGGDVLAFLDAAGRRPGPGGRLVVATARPIIMDTAPGWASGARLLSLEQLHRDRTIELVRALVGDAFPTSLLELISERADGNPLFVEELLRAWIGTGRLIPEADGAFRFAGSASQIDVPTTVRAIYAAQLDDLPEDARRLARHAAVAGRRFSQAALPALEVNHSLPAIDVLRRRSFISGPHPDRVTGEAYVYRHALLRDAAYASLARADRSRLHLRLAEWLEEAIIDRWADAAELVGRHYAAAAEAAPALSQQPAVDRLRERAADWLERAADIAAAVAAHDAARALLRDALAIAPDQPLLTQARQLCKLGQITAHTDDMQTGADLLQQAADHYASALESPSDWADARDGYATAIAALATVRYEQLAFRDGAELAASALGRIGDREDLPTARLLTGHAQCFMGESDDPTPVRHHLDRALAIAEQYGDDRLRIVALKQLAIADPQRQVELCQQIEQQARKSGDWQTVVSVMGNQAAYALCSDITAAAATIEKADEICIAYSFIEDGAWLDYLRAETAMLTGDWDEAMAAGRRAIASAAAHGFDRVQIRTWFVLTPIAAAREEDGFEQVHRWLSTLGPAPDSLYARIMLAALQLRLADAGLVQPFVPEVEPRLPAFDAYPLDMPSWVAAVERIVGAWLAAGEFGAVRNAIDSSTATRKRGGPSLLGPVAEALLSARLARAKHNQSAAVGLAREAADLARRARAPWWQLQASRLLVALQAADETTVADLTALANKLRVASELRG